MVSGGDDIDAISFDDEDGMQADIVVNFRESHDAYTPQSDPNYILWQASAPTKRPSSIRLSSKSRVSPCSSSPL
jgi:hypothetical protein